MEARYHKAVTTKAIGDHVSDRALQAMIAGNLGQDSLINLLRPEIHFDDSLFEEAYEYIDQQGQLAMEGLAAGEDVQIAWQAWGRMTHSYQDFYSHSNYLTLWADIYAPEGLSQAPPIDPLLSEIMLHPDLISGRVYLPLEALTLFKVFRPLISRLLPADSHANMNLDYPSRGPLFPISLQAAQKRTEIEFRLLSDRIAAELGEVALNRFYGREL